MRKRPQSSAEKQVQNGFGLLYLFVNDDQDAMFVEKHPTDARAGLVQNVWCNDVAFSRTGHDVNFIRIVGVESSPVHEIIIMPWS